MRPAHTPTARKRSTLFYVILITLLLALTFTAVFGTIAAVRASRAVMRYEGVTVTEGMYNYFASYCKTDFIRSLREQGINASDTSAFFSKTSEGGSTYGADFLAYCESYVRAVLASAHAFDLLVTLTADERASIREGVDQLVTYRADGNRGRFEELVQPYGFTYRDMINAATLQYKANRVFSVLYGQGGSLLKQDSGTAAASYYEESFVRVELLMIRTETKFVTDEQGNRIPNGDGTDKTVALTPTEVAERTEDIARLDAALEALANGTEPFMTPEMIRAHIKKYGELGEGYPYDETGWYLAEGAAFTDELATRYPEIVNIALSAEIGSFTRVACDFGVCYVYKTPLSANAYKDDALAAFFSDFYVDAATRLHTEQVRLWSEDVVKTRRFDSLDPLAVPKNTDFLVRI